MYKAAIIDSVLNEARVAIHLDWKHDMSVGGFLSKVIKDYPESEKLIQPDADPVEAQKFKNYVVAEFKKRFDEVKRKTDVDYTGLEKHRIETDLKWAIEGYLKRNKLRTENAGAKELQSYKDLLAKGFRDTTSHLQELNGTVEFTVDDDNGISWQYFYNDGWVKIMNPESYKKLRRDIARVQNLDEGFKAMLADHNKRQERIRKHNLTHHAY
jgi:hypothetical protein